MPAGKKAYILPAAVLLLAIDQSGACGSAAALDGARVLAERSWNDPRLRSQSLFAALPDLAASAGVPLDRFEGYAVGTGPGSFNGLRTALAAVLGLALPGRAAVYAISSAEALAWQLAERAGVESVRLVGDARRGRWWTRRFDRCEGRMAACDDWRLIEPGAVPGDAALVATADWERIGAALRTCLGRAARLIEGAPVLCAASLGRLAARRLAAAVPSERLDPVYLHPAVAPKTGDCQPGSRAL